MKPRVAVLGCTGMLGHVVAKSFSTDLGFETTCFSRKSTDPIFYIDALSTDLWMIEAVDYVINCIGLIKQIKDANKRDMFQINSVFPWLLQEHCKKIGARLIQVSTDCVFSGNRGSYSETDVADPVDDYGFSKLCGEPTSSMVVRTSVIGRELRGKLSFLEWAIANHGCEVNGYANHFWNGVTSDAYAQICKQIIKNNLYNEGVFHIFSNTVSKYEMLCMLNKELRLDLDVKMVQAVPIDRSLSSTKSLCNKLNIPSVEQMIADLRNNEQD